MSIISTYITNQKILASTAGISAEHLSYIKNGKRIASPELGTLLESITGIEQELWTTFYKRATLKRKLKQFFTNQKKEEDVHGTQTIN